MGKELNINIFSKKDARITILSMVIVCIIFFSQLFLFYRLYESNIDLLQRELNLAVDRVYKEDLDRRLVGPSRNHIPYVAYYGPNKPDEVTDTTKVTSIQSHGALKSKGPVVTLNAAMEEYISRNTPINLHCIDSIASLVFESTDISNSFYSEIIDVENAKVLETSRKSDVRVLQTLSSNYIPLNAAQTKVLRITLINPLASFYLEIAIMFVLSFALSLICLYSFYVHQRSLARQKEVGKLKNDLFADISHEFKRPLQMLRMVMSSLSKEEFLMNLDKRNRFLRIGNREVAKMDDQREMILTMTKDDEGFLELNYSEFDLAEVISESAKRYEDAAENPGDLQVEIVNQIPYDSYVKADKEHITLIISNLIENAVKYSAVPAKININLYRDNKSVCFSVSDNGIGISEENLSMIFDRFSRVQGAETNAKGYGIGLNYVKRMVERHQGKIIITSKLGEGSTFLIVIPQ